MNKIITTSLTLFFANTFSFGQNLDYNNNVESIEICTAIQGNNFSSVTKADNALDKILAVIGASKRFVLQECSNINNAVALTYNGVRYIMYDPKFMKSLSGSNQWSNMFILAHEVGHHINGHTVDVLASNNQNRPSLATQRQQELESDEFAGFVLGRLGASLSQTISAINSLPSNTDDTYSTHPSKSKRLAAIKKGFNESGGYVDTSDLDSSKGKTVDSKYSNSRFAGVEYQKLTNYYSDAVYEGYVSVGSGEPFGYGKQLMNNGNVYEGEMSGGKRNGYGVFKFPNGNKYEGDWVNNQATGKGIFSYASGKKEIGNFLNMQLDGKGTIIYSNGTDEGFYKNGNEVLITNKNKDGVKTEYGFLDNSGGNGFTTFTFLDGVKITSSFSDGVIKKSRGIFGGKGEGFLGLEVNKKAFRLGLRSVYDYIPAIVREGLDIIKPVDSYLKGYTGDFLCFGTIHWTDGAKYEGFFKSGTKHKAGYGEVIYGTEDLRSSYFGIWWNDKKNGYGILTYKNGKVEKGIFRNNVFFKSEDFDLELMQSVLKNF